MQNAAQQSSGRRFHFNNFYFTNYSVWTLFLTTPSIGLTTTACKAKAVTIENVFDNKVGKSHPYPNPNPTNANEKMPNGRNLPHLKLGHFFEISFSSHPAANVKTIFSFEFFKF